ncbi:MAG: hypothetical protein K0S42_31 [Microvirga sp.]|jgi:tetratricopeptide (TPR) repeat protein|nr:hypothetical protein [Microvirga sp.]
MNTTAPARPRDERLERLLNFLKIDPRNPTLLVDALQTALQHEAWETCHFLLAHAAEHGIEDARLDAHAGLIWLRSAQYQLAAEHGERALAAGLQNPSVFLNTGFAHFYSGRYDRAEELLAPLCQDEACDAATLILTARVKQHLEKTDDAIGLAMRATEAEADNAEAWGVLALAQSDDGQDREALVSVERALALAPTQLDALLAGGAACTELENFAAAQAYYERAVEHHPDCGRAWSGLGRLDFQDFKFDEAEQHLLRAVAFMTNHIGTWHLLAWIYILRGHSVPAREALQQAYAIDRNFGETHGSLAVVDAMEGDEETAWLGIRRALKLDPDNMAAHYAETLLRERAGDKPGAQAAFARIIDRPVNGDTGRSLVEKRLATLLNQKNKPQSLH